MECLGKDVAKQSERGAARVEPVCNGAQASQHSTRTWIVAECAWQAFSIGLWLTFSLTWSSRTPVPFFFVCHAISSCRTPFAILLVS
jgi:hypothetical protein